MLPGLALARPGHAVRAVSQQSGAGTLDQPRGVSAVCLSWPGIACPANPSSRLLPGRASRKHDAVLPLSPRWPGSHCLRDAVQAPYITSRSVHELAPRAFLPSPPRAPPGLSSQALSCSGLLTPTGCGMSPGPPHTRSTASGFSYQPAPPRCCLPWHAPLTPRASFEAQPLSFRAPHAPCDTCCHLWPAPRESGGRTPGARMDLILKIAKRIAPPYHSFFPLPHHLLQT